MGDAYENNNKFFFYYIINLDVSGVNFDYCNEFILKDRDIGVVWVNSKNKNNVGKISKLSEDWIRYSRGEFQQMRGPYTTLEKSPKAKENPYVTIETNPKAKENPYVAIETNPILKEKWKLEDDNKQLKNEIRELKGENRKLKDKNRKLMNENANLSNNLTLINKQMEDKFQELEDKINQLVDENQQMRNEIQQLRNENQQLKDEIQQLKGGEKTSDVSFRKNIVDSTKNQNGKRNCQIQIATTDDEDMNSSGYVSDSAPAESESDDFESLI